MVEAVLKSSMGDLIAGPVRRTATMQGSSLSVVGPSTWNGLPLAIRQLQCQSSVSPAAEDYFFSAWPGSGALLNKDLEGALYKF